VPARCRTERRSAGPSPFASVSARRRRRACHRSHHLDSFCGGHLLFAYVCFASNINQNSVHEVHMYIHMLGYR